MRTSYTGYAEYFGGTVYRATGSSTCRTSASCVGTADETVTTTSYGTLTANNLLPVSSTAGAGDGSISTNGSASYDAVGNVVSATDPLGAVTHYSFDADRWPTLVVGPDPDGAGPLHNRAARTNYNADGTVVSSEVGTANPDGSGFVSLQQISATYDAAGRKLTDTASAGGTTYAVTQYGYDPANRVTCTALRMNPGAFGSLPGSACSLGAQGSDGPDRITRTSYDELGRPATTTAGYGTAEAAVEASLTYTGNGQTQSASDGNGNTTTYGYDAYDRSSTTTYPGGSYEQLGYDAAGDVASRRLRDGQSIAYSYDALHRVTFADNPHTSVAEVGYTYSYDLLGRLVNASDQNGWYNAVEYDALGRVTRQFGNVGDNHLAFDAGGRLLRETWGDGFFVTYEYDQTGATTVVRENGGLALASFGYDDLGRRTSLLRGNGTVTSYAHDPASRLASLGQDLVGTAQDLSLGFAHNAAGQITTRTSSNDAYAWTGAANANKSYASNALNQYTQAGGTALGYDGRGNLTSAGGQSFQYNRWNQLYGNGTGQLFYHNPTGNIGLTPNTNYDYVGDRLVTEANGGVLRRYVWGPGVDEPLVWYEGSGTGDRRYLHADERGSVVAVTNDAGTATAINTYDEYGIPGANNQGRFGYTGQKWIAELGLYDYKARMYSPSLGRFLQTDPIGYGDGLNWYNYVGGDPVNGTDPSGLLCIGGGNPGAGEAACIGARGTYIPDIIVPGRRPSRDPCAGVSVNAQCYSAEQAIRVKDALNRNIMAPDQRVQDGDIVVIATEEPQNVDQCTMAAGEPGKIRATGITGSVTGLFGVTVTEGTWVNLKTGSTGSFESSGFTAGLGIGAARQNITYDNMGTFLGLSDGASLGATILPMGPIGVGGGYSWSWNSSGRGQGGGGTVSPSFLPRFSAEVSSTVTNISNCRAKGK